MTHKVKEIPEWFRLLNPNALVSLKDAAVLFGFKSVEALRSSIKGGSFPQPQHSMRWIVDNNKHRWKTTRFTMNNKMFYTVAELKAELRKRMEAHNV